MPVTLLYTFVLTWISLSAGAELFDSRLLLDETREVEDGSLPVADNGSALKADSPDPSESTTPSVTKQNSAPLGFERIVYRIPSGTEVGYGYNSAGRRTILNWGSGFAVSDTEQQVTILDELRKAGLDVRGGEDLVFGQNHQAEAEKLLGGVVDSFKYQALRQLGTPGTHANLSIEWQVLDVRTKEVRFTHRTTAQLSLNKAIEPIDALNRMLISTLDEVLKMEEFRATISISSIEFTQQTPVAYTPCSNPHARSLPTDLPKAMEACLIVRAGGRTGTGVVISTDGLAVTADHVVSGSAHVEIILSTGILLDGTIVRSDPARDLALVKISGKGLACLPLANAEPTVGTNVFAVGTTVGSDSEMSVTRGIVSGIRIGDGWRYLQTDASLNPGNSGGPLLDEKGNILAIVSFKIVGEGIEGLGFGVPATTIVGGLVPSP